MDDSTKSPAKQTLRPGRTLMCDDRGMLEKVVVGGPAACDWATGYAVQSDAVVAGEDLIAFLRGATSPSALSDVGGSFAAVLVLHDRLRIISDRVGSRPVFYARSESAWLAGPEFWTLAGRLGSSIPSAESAVQLLAFKFVLGAETISHQVFEVPPGTWLDLFDDGRTDQHRYWRYRPQPRERSGRQLVAELSDVIEGMATRSIRAGKLQGLEHWGVNLTAGRDSRLLFGALVRAGVPITACSSDVGADARVAAEVAAAVGVQHRTNTFWADLGSPWIPEVADPLVGTTMAAVAGHPISLSLDRPSECSGWVSGHLGDRFAGGQLPKSLMGRPQVDIGLLKARLVEADRSLSDRELVKVLRPEWRALVRVPSERMREVVAESDDGDLGALLQRVDLEQRQRRFILRDYMAIRTLGPTVLWLGDPAWSDFWASVPYRWLVGTSLYSRVLKEKVFVGDLAPLAKIPANDRRLTTVRLPRLAVTGRELKRRAFKRLKRTVPAWQPHRTGLTDRALELASWLIEPDYFKTPRRRSDIESVRSIARATELLNG